MSFTNKVVLITGASSGIGAATAIAFAKEGATLSIIGRNDDRLREVEKQCENHGAKVLFLKADISVDNAANKSVEATIERFGRLDILVNNAGFIRCAELLNDNVMENFDEVMNTNLRALVHMTSLAAHHLVKTKGNIINVSSVLAQVILATYMPYSVSKAGVDHFSRHAALQLAPYGIRVNTINPGPVETPIFNVKGNEYTASSLAQLTALKKPSDPEEIADLILYLASDKAKSVTGGNYYIDNGFTLKN